MPRDLSEVRIEPNLIANETDPSARLTVGQEMTDELKLVYSTKLTDSNDQIWLAEYDITRRFQTQGVAPKRQQLSRWTSGTMCDSAASGAAAAVGANVPRSHASRSRAMPLPDEPSFRKLLQSRAGRRL